MKKIITAIMMVAAVTTIAILSNSCSATKGVETSGSDLWENYCGRCHNAPPTSMYTAEQWEVLGTHMKMRAQIRDDEVQKIVAFLKK
jgi:cytochrome c553